MRSDPDEPPRLFVYGTLLSTEPQHALLSGTRYLGEASTAAGFELRDLGDYPAAVCSDRRTPLSGELYEVEPQLWAQLDAYEDERVFRRTTVLLAGGQPAQMYVWAGPVPSEAPVIAGGDWRQRHRT